MKVVPIFQKAAFAFIESYHRHHKKPVGSIFQIALANDEKIVGVAVVGRPVSRHLQQDENFYTAEVTRLCTDGTPNACSMLYAACWNASKNLGYTRLITYILDTEPGTSLRGAGWHLVGIRGGGSWSVPSRPRIDKHPIQQKLLFQKTI